MTMYMSTKCQNTFSRPGDLEGENLLKQLRSKERAERAAAENSLDDEDRRVHQELAQLIYARRKRLEANGTRLRHVWLEGCANRRTSSAS